ncbi:excalibur calcium-binding domain-containing protein [Nocardia sp. NPDC004750]
MCRVSPSGLLDGLRGNRVERRDTVQPAGPRRSCRGEPQGPDQRRWIPETQPGPIPAVVPTPPAAAVPVPPRPAAPSVYYSNCAAAKAAGAAPLRRGEPGYRSELDRDKDGIACE